MNIMIFTKIPSFILLGLVKFDSSSKMRSSRIALKSGKISPRQYCLPNGFEKYLFAKAREVTESYNQIPEAHLKKIDDFIVKNPEKAANSKLFESFLYDHERFGDKVFKGKSDRKSP